MAGKEREQHHGVLPVGFAADKQMGICSELEGKSKKVVPACSQNHCLVPGTFESAFSPLIHIPNSLTIALSNPVLSQT